MRVLTDDELKIVRCLHHEPALSDGFVAKLFTKLASYIGRNVSLLLERTDEVRSHEQRTRRIPSDKRSRLCSASTR